MGATLIKCNVMYEDCRMNMTSIKHVYIHTHLLALMYICIYECAERYLICSLVSNNFGCLLKIYIVQQKSNNYSLEYNHSQLTNHNLAFIQIE